MPVSSIKTPGLLVMALILASCEAGSFLEPKPQDEDPDEGAVTVASLAMDSVRALITEDDTLAFRVIALDTAGDPIDGLDIQWSSTDERVAHIESTGGTEGTLTALSPGTTTITASYEDLSASTTVEVHKRPVDLVYSSGSGQTGPPGAQLPDSVVVRVIDKRGDPVSGVYLDFAVVSGGGAASPGSGTTDGTGSLSATWTLGASGDQILEARASEGQARVKKMQDSVVVFTAQLVDTTATGEVASVTITPDSAVVPEDSTVELQTEVKDANGNNLSNPSVQWTSTDTTVAHVDGNGLVTPRGVGAVRILAQSGNVADSADVEVTPVTVATVTVDPAIDTVAVDSTLQLSASVHDASGNPLDRTVTWFSSDTSIATVDPDGLVSGLAQGDIVVSATADDVGDTASITVVESAEGTLTISPSADTLYGIGGSVTLTAEARAADGSLISDPGIEWSSQDTSIATVDSMGTVIARSLGTVIIAASAICCTGDFAEIAVRNDTTSSDTTDTEPPTAPSGLTATAVSISRIDLSWSASSDDVGVEGYRVYRDGNQVADVSATSYDDTGLQAATTYSYTVAAYDAAGNVSTRSESVSATTASGGSTLSEVVVPSASDFTDRGVAFGPSSGGWDRRLSAGTPGTIVKIGSTYYAYYVGADGNRGDGGPADRSVGLVTSSDGVNWTKHAANPVIPYLDLNSNGDNEEGAWRLAVTKDTDGSILMYISRLTGSGGSVGGPIYLFTSNDGINWSDHGQIIDPGDSSFPGSDEFGAIGATVHDGTYHFWYAGKGEQDYFINHTSAGTRDDYTSGTQIWAPANPVRYGSNPIQISDTEWALVFAQLNGDITLFRTSDLSSRGSQAVQWDGDALSGQEAGNIALYLDRDAGRWILLLGSAPDRNDDDWTEVRVFTAPVTLAN